MWKTVLCVCVYVCVCVSHHRVCRQHATVSPSLWKVVMPLKREMRHASCCTVYIVQYLHFTCSHCLLPVMVQFIVLKRQMEDAFCYLQDLLMLGMYVDINVILKATLSWIKLQDSMMRRLVQHHTLKTLSNM